MPVFAQSDNPYTYMRGFPGLMEEGNLDLTNRQLIDMSSEAQGDPRAYGSEYSTRYYDKNHIAVIPRIWDGKLHSEEDAQQRYAEALQRGEPGEHMGKFEPNTPNFLIDPYENALHSRPQYVNGELMNGDLWRSLNDPNSLRNVNKRILR